MGVATPTTLLRELREWRLGGGDEGAEPALVLAAGRRLDAGADVDAPRADGDDGVTHVLGREPAGEHHTGAGGRVLRQRPVVRDAGAAAARAVDDPRVGAVIGGPLQRAVAGGERLQHRADALAHPTRVDRGL